MQLQTYILVKLLNSFIEAISCNDESPSLNISQLNLYSIGITILIVYNLQNFNLDKSQKKQRHTEYQNISIKHRLKQESVFWHFD